MAPRTALRCGSAVRRHLFPVASAQGLVPTAEAVWITDALLARAFAHYCRCFSSATATTATTTSQFGSSATSSVACPPRAGTRRFASNVPGPLESRRRLGKRQMTEQLGLPFALHPSAASSSPLLPPPVWALPNAADLRQWQWSPPRDARDARDAPAATATKRTDTQRLGEERSDRAGPTVSSSSSSSWLATAARMPSLGLPRWLAELGGADEDAAPQPPLAAARTDEADASAEPSTTRPRNPSADLLFAKLQAWRDALDAGGGDPTTALSPDDGAYRVDGLCSEFQTQLSLAALTADEACEVLGRLWDGLRGRTRLFEQHAAAVVSAALDGVAACRLLHARDLGAGFWRRLLVCAAALPENNDNNNGAAARLAFATLVATPAECVNAVADVLPLVVSKALCHNDEHSNDRGSVEGVSQQVARALQSLDLEPPHNSHFVSAATEFVIRRVDDQQGAAISSSVAVTNAHRAWLFTLAHMPQVRQESLYKTMARLQSQEQEKAVPALVAGGVSIDDGTRRHMDGRVLCQLLLAQWRSRGYVTAQVQRTFDRLLRTGDAARHPGHGRGDGAVTAHTALAALALAVFRSKPSRLQCGGLYASLWTCLRALGREDDLVSSVETWVRQHMDAAAAAATATATADAGTTTTATTKPPPLAFFEALAWAADDVHVARRLHALYMDYVRGQLRPSWPLWHVGFWDKYAGRLGAALHEGALTPKQLAYVLDLPHRAKLSGRHPTNKKGPVGAPTVALVETLAAHYALAPELGPRRALRGVEHCWAFLAKHGPAEHGPTAASSTSTSSVSSSSSSSASSTTSPTVLRALFHLISRDLANAQPGRTTRLQWFLRLVEREYGETTATATARALSRWRDVAMRYRNAEAAESESQRWDKNGAAPR
ncbi:fungal specific transcription factor domain containing protein [Niveomyces insectorum RCEF 264]|uniref:Fungal specific transcription factor domain containing protein n=1 Tax=Niveomyces insectorum RCEF 264 TaxID=1081102 RepID=A0A167U4H0_9HYPO|nr:fungal specific transcription factor domain containing protein [Niveomyces insectorum RCEF 264]